MPEPLDRDWRRYVRVHLPPLAVAPEREAEIVEQLAGQLQDLYDDALRTGSSEQEALAAAEASISSWTGLAKALMKDERAVVLLQVVNRIEAAGDFGRDAVYLLRSMRKAPLLYGAIVLILASTVGLSSVVFGAVYGILLKPFPFANYDRVELVTEQRPDGRQFSISAPNFMDWRERNDVFEELAAFQSVQLTLGDVDRPERLQGVSVSANFFGLLGLQPVVGRGFVAGEDQQGAPNVAVLSDSLWTRRFGRDPAVVGGVITPENRPYTVAGILPAFFEFPAARRFSGGTTVDVLIPFKFDPVTLRQRGNHYFVALALRKDGISEEQARASMVALATRMSEEYPPNKGWGVQMQPLDTAIFGENRRILTLLLAAVGLLVLIGCANIASLLLARGAVRAREFALRLSLGCSATRLVRQMSTESVLLAFIGGALGLAIAYPGLDILLRMAPRDVTRIESVEMNTVVLAFSVAMCSLTAIAFGVGPAWQASRTHAADALRSGGRTMPGSGALRLERPLIVIEVALTTLLMIGAGLMVESLRRLQDVDLGFQAEGVATFRVQPTASQYPERGDQQQYFRAIRDRVAAIPGVESVSSTWFLPIAGGAARLGYVPVGADGPIPSEGGSALWYSVMPGYFEAMGIPLLLGRDFTEQDTLDAPHRVLINQLFAEHVFGAADPIGRRLTSSGDLVEIIGVVGNTINVDLKGTPEEQYYAPLAGTPFSFSLSRTFVVRAGVPPETLFPAISRAVLDVDRNLPASNLFTIEKALRDETATPRTAASLLSAFALLALGLAGAGVYAVVAYFVARRMPEFGIRAALGADSRMLFQYVLWRGVLLSLPGLILGVVAALGATRYLESLLFEVQSRDVATFAATAGTILVASLAACAVPAFRAARTNPMSALRED